MPTPYRSLTMVDWKHICFCSKLAYNFVNGYVHKKVLFWWQVFSLAKMSSIWTLLVIVIHENVITLNLRLTNSILHWKECLHQREILVIQKSEKIIQDTPLMGGRGGTQIIIFDRKSFHTYYFRILCRYSSPHFSFWQWASIRAERLCNYCTNAYPPKNVQKPFLSFHVTNRLSIIF